MERIVQFRDRQEQQAADHNNLQAFVRESVDDLVNDTVTSGKAFAGLTVTQTTSTAVAVAAGRLFSGGQRFVLEDVLPVNLFNLVPLTVKKIVAIVAWGITADYDTQPRDFLINADTREVEPAPVAMESRRAVSVQAIGGGESPDPQKPTLDVGVLAIAWVTMDPTGILSVAMAVENYVPSLVDHEQRIDNIETFDDTVGPELTNLKTSLANLAASLQGLATNRDLVLAYADIARLKALASLPAVYSDYSADEFLTYDFSDLTDLTFLATVDEGVRFSPEAIHQAELSIYSGLDPGATLIGGFLLPKYNPALRLASVGGIGTLNISQYGYQTSALVQKHMSRKRTRYGGELTVCTNGAFWQSGTYNPVTHIFTRQGETFVVLDPALAQINHRMIRLQEYWIDTYQVPYWEWVVTPHTVYGATMGQTWLNSHDGWLVQVGLYLGALAAAGDITIDICGVTPNGAPDPGNVIQHVVAVRAGLVANALNIIAIPATFLAAGNRYSMILTAGGAHFISYGAASTTIEGTMFYSTDGLFYAGDIAHALCFNLYFASFVAARQSINMAGLELSGGIAKIDILAEMVEPAATALVWEIQLGGPTGAWTALTDLNPGALVGLPPLIPLRATFLGTSDIAPGIALTGSQVTISRPRTGFLHLSLPRLPAAPTSSIKVIARLEHWKSVADGGHHTMTATILPFGAGANSSPVIADQKLDAFTTLRTMTFTMEAPTSNFRIEMDGITTTPLDVFHVAERVDIEA